jgi:hypothetical protein
MGRRRRDPTFGVAQSPRRIRRCDGSATCLWFQGGLLQLITSPDKRGEVKRGPGQGGVTREQVVEGLRPLLALPVKSCSRRTEHRQTVLGSSARSPDG